MSWYDKSSWRKAFLSRHLGVGSAVYPCPRMALILTSAIEKEAQILQVTFHRSFTPRMALPSYDHVGVLSWLACHSSHVSTSEIGGSGRSSSAPPSEFGSTLGSLNITLLPDGSLLGTLVVYPGSHPGGDSGYEPCNNSCFDFCLFSGYSSCCSFQSRFVVHPSFPFLTF